MRAVAVGLQVIAFGEIVVALGGVLSVALGQSTAGSSGRSAALVYAVALAGLLGLGILGLRRWIRGDSATLLYVFDAIPVVFILGTAGPGAMADVRGLLITAGFVVPAIVVYAADRGAVPAG